MFVVRIVGIVCCLMAFVVPSQVSAQQEEETMDVIYLKDGRIIRGIILEKTDETLSVRTGSNRVISLGSMDQVARLRQGRNVLERERSARVLSKQWLLSALLPGCGQFYNGQHRKGGIQLVIYGIGWGLALWGGTDVTIIETPGYYSRTYSPTTTSYIGFGLLAGTWLWSVIDAPISAKNINKKEYGHLIKLGD